MKKYFLLSLLTSLAFAGDASKESKFLIRPTSPEVDVSSLAAPNVKVLPAPKRTFASSLPSVADRDRIFQLSGLKESLENWDDFEKDSLYIKLTKDGSGVIERILIKHPELNRAALEKAQLIIKDQSE